jgi:hypothetical protein
MCAVGNLFPNSQDSSAVRDGACNFKRLSQHGGRADFSKISPPPSFMTTCRMNLISAWSIFMDSEHFHECVWVCVTIALMDWYITHAQLHINYIFIYIYNTKPDVIGSEMGRVNVHRVSTCLLLTQSRVYRYCYCMSYDTDASLRQNCPPPHLWTNNLYPQGAVLQYLLGQTEGGKR